MFILELTYTVSLDRVDELLDDHLAWLTTQYEAGLFIASGRKEPRDGGVIIAAGNDRSAIQDLVRTDPLSIAEICDYRIIEFFATTVAPALERYRDTPPS